MKTLFTRKNKALGFGLIDALLAFLLLSPVFYLYSTTQVGQKVSFINSAEINQAVSLAENVRLTLIAQGRKQVQDQPSISDNDFSHSLHMFSLGLSRQYSSLRRAEPCNQNEPMMGWTGNLCSSAYFIVDIDTFPYSVAEKGQPINIKVSWENQSGKQVYNVRALIGKF